MSDRPMGDPKKKWGMAIDIDRCVGCWACSIACTEQNDVPMGMTWNRILTDGGKHHDMPSGTYPNVDITYYPVACQQCENAPCVEVCPTGATYKRDDGIVAIDYDRCIGCRYCMAACPYGARVFNWSEPKRIPSFEIGASYVPARHKGVVEKCTFCVERVDMGKEPFCVEACPYDARIFGDLNNPESEISQLLRTRGSTQLLQSKGTKPRVFYLTKQAKQALGQGVVK